MKKFFYSVLFAAIGAFAFTACEDVPEPYTTPTVGGDSIPDSTNVIVATGDGSEANPYNVVGIKEFIDGGDYAGKNVYFKGIVTSFKSGEEPGNSYGNATFYIADEAGGSNTFYCYRILGFDNKSFTSSDADLFGVGDTVVVCGQVTLYNNSVYETNQKAACLVSVNGKTSSSTSGDDDEPTTTTTSLPYSEAFSTTLGTFTNYTTSGSGAWTIDYSTAKATGYDNSSKTTTAGTFYLVSSEIDLTSVTAAHVTYSYILRYNKDNANQQLLISDAFDASNPAEGWTVLNETHTVGSDWSTFSDADIEIPSTFIGKKVRIALKYNTNATSGSTWEVKNFTVAEK